MPTPAKTPLKSPRLLRARRYLQRGPSISSILRGVVTRTRNVNEYMLVLALCLVLLLLTHYCEMSIPCCLPLRCFPNARSCFYNPVIGFRACAGAVGLLWIYFELHIAYFDDTNCRQQYAVLDPLLPARDHYARWNKAGPLDSTNLKDAHFINNLIKIYCRVQR